MAEDDLKSASYCSKEKSATSAWVFNLTELRPRLKSRGAFDSAKNHKRQRRKRQSVTAKREKSKTPKFV